MSNWKLPHPCWAMLTLALAQITVPAAAQKPFYQDRQITLLSNFAPGGPNDIEARLLARHLSRHIAGQPSVVVQNKEGAGGLVGAKYIGEIAPRDGSVFGYLTGAAWKYMIEPEKFAADFRNYEFLGNLSGNAVYYLRSDTPPGMKQAADLVKAQGVVAGGVSLDASKDLRLRITLDLLGVPYRYVSGYRSGATARLALQRGEINFFSESTPGYLTVVEPTMVNAGMALPIFYDPDSDGTGFRTLDSMDRRSIPSFPEYYRKVKASEPSGPLWDIYRSPLANDNAMLRSLVMPPGTPQAAVDALRAALASINDDQDFSRDAIKTIQFAPRYDTGPDINTRTRAALAIAPETRQFVLNYLKR